MRVTQIDFQDLAYGLSGQLDLSPVVLILAIYLVRSLLREYGAEIV